MTNTIIIVSGMPGTGKTSFARWLSSKLHIPLVCYDHVKTKSLELARATFENEEQRSALWRFPLGYLWFFCEEIMQSSSPLIVEYFFIDRLKEEVLDGLLEEYEYRALNIHLDTSTQVAYRRYCQRNRLDQGVEGLRPEISFEQFEKGTKANKDFRYGDRIVEVDTTDFAKVSYEDILEQVKSLI